MRKEYINYPPDMPLNINFLSIKDYPIHWHNSLEILYVLKGKVNISLDGDNFELYEGELEIINPNETHRIYSNDENNKILIFHFDPSFFEKYYNDIENMIFYTNTSIEGIQESEEYDDLRTYLSIILCESIQKIQDYDEAIEEHLISLLYHLINNFHYLIYEKEELKDNEEQLERYHRISKYIFNNYNDKISLQDIAKKEFLSTHYLSHEIKNATGYSFTDLLNLTRVEESLKLLLDSDKSISEISDEVGFSHPRYYNKNFKLYYGLTPLQYRKKYKLTEEEYEKNKKFTKLPLCESLVYLHYYLEDYPRFNYENKINKININMNDSLGFLNKDYKEIINIGDAFDLLIEDNKDIIEEIQSEINFEYGRIENIFHKDMGIFKGSKFYNWNRTKSVLEFMNSINLKPLIVLDLNELSNEEFIRAFNSFLVYFYNLDSIDFKELMFDFSSNMDFKIKESVTKILNEYNLNLNTKEPLEPVKINNIYDSSYMLPFIIHNTIIKHKSFNYLRAFDVLEKEVELTNEVFFGYPGLVNDMGIKKSSYYAYYLLNMLGEEIVSKGDGYIVTKDKAKKEYQILLYSYDQALENLMESSKVSKALDIKKNREKTLSLNIVNINSAIKLTFYEINERIGSSYNYWNSMGRPNRLTKEEKEILHKAAFPQIYFKNYKKSTVVNIVKKLEGYGAVLIILKEVQK